MNYAVLLVSTLLFSGIAASAQEGSGRHLGRPSPKGKGPAKASKYKIADFEGRWQEVGRTNSATQAPVAVTDTIYLRFYDGTKADTKEGASIVITGASSIMSDDYVSTSANDYKIISLAGNQLVLDDDNGFIHTFTKKDIFAYELGTAPPVAAVDTSAAIVNLTPAALQKSWFAYRRAASPGVITNQTAIIRSLKITAAAGNSIYKGEIESSKGGTATIKPCTIKINDNNAADIITDTDTWNVMIYKCDGGEMILGKKEGVVYYFKNNN